jgi:hypothetical protein
VATIRAPRLGVDVEWDMVRERLRPIRRLLVALASVALLLGWGTAAADLYRWVDAKGVVNYSNIPPQGVEATQIPETQPTVSVIPPPERQAELRQAAHEAELLRRLEQLEDELAAMRASAPTVVYTYPPPEPAVTYAAPFVYPYAVYPYPVYAPRGRNGFKGSRPAYGWGHAPGAMPPVPAPHGGRAGLPVRGRF